LQDHSRQAETDRAQANYLAQLATRRNSAWADVEALVSTRQLKGYDQAICLLHDLREVAAHSGDTSRFAVRLAALLQRHAKKEAFRARVSRARMMPEPARAC
jgi:hypothetical protein